MGDAVLVVAPWWAESRASEVFPYATMAPQHKSPTKTQSKKRKGDDVEPSSSDDESVDNWPSFLIMEGGDAGGQPVKLNPTKASKVLLVI